VRFGIDNMVICNNCNKEFDALFDDASDQAYACSAVIHDTAEGSQYLVGYYGSFVIDGDLYKVLTDKYKNEDILCDECVTQGISNEDFKLVSVNNYFDINI
jgi:hypothetical protein